MSICDIKINNDITSPCNNPLYTGKKQKGWLINRDDVASYTLTGNYVTGITLVTGAQAYFIECNEKRPYQGTITAMEDGDTQNTFAHTVLCHMQNDGADFRTNVIEKLAGGRFVVILENLWGGENNDSFFPVYGLQRGLDCVAETTEDADNGGWNFTLAETGLPMAGLYYWHTDEETSRNDLDALAGGGGGEDWTPKWFYVEDASGAANTLTIKKSNNALADKVFDWSLDKQTWTTVTVTDTTGVNISVPASGKVYLRGDTLSLSENASNYIKLATTGKFNIGGDITTLIEKHGNQLVVKDYCFVKLCRSNYYLYDISNLIIPCVQVGAHAFEETFASCSYIGLPPQFTGAYLLCSTNSLNNFLQACTRLTKMPILPPIKAGAGYSLAGLIQGCPAVTETSNIDIQMTSIPNNMLTQMCQGCTSLNKVVVKTASWNTSAATNWLLNVPATGDFYNLGGATIPTGTNGIPSGWTEHTQLP